MRISSLRIFILTTFINSSDILPISASLAPHPVRCYQNLRETSRLQRTFRRTCSTGFAPLRYRRRTPSKATDGHTSGSATCRPDRWNNDSQSMSSYKGRTSHVAWEIRCLCGIGKNAGEIPCTKDRPRCGEVESTIPTSSHGGGVTRVDGPVRPRGNRVRTLRVAPMGAA